MDNKYGGVKTKHQSVDLYLVCEKASALLLYKMKLILIPGLKSQMNHFSIYPEPVIPGLFL